ncbi:MULTISPECIES: DNA polymerase III subunit delta [unclassified Leptolyngbya]|uniref:DNA polymerase III subunit delta n=1 Tax=unclassified Leptolyngbya TaxID=2650499 RepID=UPI001683491D|nr:MULTISPECIES: DNA polymerase III subunit delta [unclassified Leptolyngbya]MBD1911340.1 DNA polymerase III subunit delta [Leptolyngbya sp. FACHB-8]MBD2156642.1 DNA polymerase III subunit delta [Leptolyngbya sp. FACHB-16]
MPIALFWGEDEYSMQRAIADLRDRTLDPDWASFNFDKIGPEQSDGVMNALNQAMTPPFGMGQRLVWLVDTTVCQRCSEDVLSEMERTLPMIPESTVLLLTMTNKPDGRIRSTKLMQKHADIREFAAIPPWKTDLLEKKVKQVAQELDVKLTAKAMELLAESVGNDTRQLYTELEKLSLFADSKSKPIDEDAVTTLVTATTQNSLQLAAAIRQGETGRAIALVSDLFSRNEPALRIVATLVGQFRTWLWIKLMIESGERDEKVIAKAADIANPKRIYFLQQDVRPLSLQSLRQTLPILLDLEMGLKQGADEVMWMQSKVIELCQLFQRK